MLERVKYVRMDTFAQRHLFTKTLLHKESFLYEKKKEKNKKKQKEEKNYLSRVKVKSSNIDSKNEKEIIN